MSHIASYERKEIEPNVLEEECFKLLLYCKFKQEIVQDVLEFSIDKIHFLLQISDYDNEVICKFYYSKHSHRKANDVVKFTTKCIISDTYTLICYDMQEKVVYLPSDYLGRIIPTSFYLPIFHISLGKLLTIILPIL